MRLLRQLFQVALAGTQADDRRRREALEEALEEDDPRIRRVGVEALGAMIQTHISRSEEFEQIGAEDYRPEWAPDDHGTINAYFDWALQRLLDLWRKDIELRPLIEERVAGDIRNLLSPELLPTLEIFVKEVVAASGHWFGATHGIGDWLYFDRPEEPTNFSLAVRALFDATLPTDPVDLIRLHSRFWMSDLRDPDKRYAQDQENPDYEYSARCVQALVPEIAREPDQLARAIRLMASEEMNAPQVFAHALAPELSDPLGTFEQAVAELDASGTRAGATFVASLLSALDRQLQDRPNDVNTLESIAKRSDVLAANPMHIVTSLRVTDGRLDAFTNDVRGGRVTPGQSISISYGRGLEEVSHAALARFITALVDRGDDGGAWAALEILSMVTHGRKNLAPEIVDLAKLAILSPSIADDVGGNASNADYTYDRMLRLGVPSTTVSTSRNWVSSSGPPEIQPLNLSSTAELRSSVASNFSRVWRRRSASWPSKPALANRAASSPAIKTAEPSGSNRPSSTFRRPFADDIESGSPSATLRTAASKSFRKNRCSNRRIESSVGSSRLARETGSERMAWLMTSGIFCIIAMMRARWPSSSTG